MKSPCAATAMVVYFNGGVGCYHKSELKGWRVAGLKYWTPKHTPIGVATQRHRCPPTARGAPKSS
jgi:hypothetical protein